MKTEVAAPRPARIRKDDDVFVISGNCRGQSGKVLRVLGDRIVIQGVNQRKKHVKPTRDTKGGIVTIERSIHASNVRLSVDGKPVKLKAKISKDGKKEFGYMNGNDWVSHRKLHK